MFATDKMARHAARLIPFRVRGTRLKFAVSAVPQTRTDTMPRSFYALIFRLRANRTVTITAGGETFRAIIETSVTMPPRIPVSGSGMQQCVAR